MDMTEDAAVSRFRDFLRIETVQPKPDYATCTSFLRQQANEIGLEVKVIECVPSKPVVILTWQGSDPSAPSLMLNCHTDVVPVFAEHWHTPPFAAEKRANGDIVARGSQDMKCVGMSYLEAIRVLKACKHQPLRTVHCVFVPDEEIGGHDGMVLFIKHEFFKQMHVGFVLDEGLAHEGAGYKVYYGERAPWWVKVTATGAVGHGSQFIQNTASQKLQKVIQTLMAYRDSEELRLVTGLKQDGHSPLTLGDVTTVNLTMLNGGVQYNVVPDKMSAGFDIRVSPLVNLKKFRAKLEEWCTDADCSLEFIQYFGTSPITALNDHNVWWKIIEKCSAEHNKPLYPEIFPAATDSRYLREIGVMAIGVSAIEHTKILLHDHNEYLNEKVYLDGIGWYTSVIGELSMVTVEQGNSVDQMVIL